MPLMVQNTFYSVHQFSGVFSESESIGPARSWDSDGRTPRLLVLDKKIKTDHHSGWHSTPLRLWFPGDENCQPVIRIMMKMVMMAIIFRLWVLLGGRRSHCPLVR